MYALASKEGVEDILRRGASRREREGGGGVRKAAATGREAAAILQAKSARMSTSTTLG